MERESTAARRRQQRLLHPTAFLHTRLEEKDILTRTAIVVVVLAALSYGLAAAQQMDPQMDCDALADAFDNYSSKLTDPDKDAATALSKEGVTDCKNGQHEQGMQKISHAMGMMHDGKASKK